VAKLTDGRRTAKIDELCAWFSGLPAASRDGVLMMLRQIDLLETRRAEKSMLPEQAEMEIQS
jgi:hypothetical protein